MTGTASRGPTYPTMPHTGAASTGGPETSVSLPVVSAAGRALLAARPFGLHDLPRAPEAQRIGGNVFGDDAPRAHVGAFADAHGGDERRVAADEGAAFD